MSQSAVSRQISALEEDLGLKLFIRHARGLVLTEVGEQLFRTAHRMHWELQQVETQMSESQDVPTGPLLVTTTVGIGSTWLSSRIDEFLLLYPDIQIEIKLNDAELDLAMREADVAIRLHRPNQSEMIQRKLFTVHNHFYASKTYLAEFGEPQEPRGARRAPDHHLRRPGPVLSGRHQLSRAPRPSGFSAAPRRRSRSTPSTA